MPGIKKTIKHRVYKLAKKNISVFLMGGVGNQLFQICRALSLSESGVNVKLVKFYGFEKFFYNLLGFSFHRDWLGIDRIAGSLNIEIEKLSAMDFLELSFIFLLRKVGINCFFDQKLKISETKSFFRIDVGYFQSSSHLTSKAIFNVANVISDSLGLDTCNKNENLTVHVRGGDFSIGDRYSTTDVNNIYKISKHLASKIVVVTNDENYARSIFKDEKISLHQSSTGALGDFKFMCSSSRLILSKSSFSAWAGICAALKHNCVVYADFDLPLMRDISEAMIYKN